jgi:predicted nucleic acid-binding protein
MNTLSLSMKVRMRIPLLDTLIAAVACQKQATLVHRDKHFKNISEMLLKMENIHKVL